MLTDIKIAQAAKIKPIEEIALKAGISKELLIHYGKYIAKIDTKKIVESGNRAKLILVTALTPTTSGEGKTTVSVGLADGLSYCGSKVMIALREPSLGPVFGMKGGATGGGYAQVLPMENINLHFTGDIHAITSANNLLAAMVDNHVQQGNTLNIDPRQIYIRRCIDINDRQIRNIVSGLGGKTNGIPREDGFDITAASEVMAVFCMARDLNDLKIKLSRIIVARTFTDKPVTCGEIGAQGAMAALLRDALMPNLVQTIEGTPCLIHGGPFANIAHGCNSVIATNLAMSLADYVVTEAGFGADLGAEKFLDIKCRKNNIWPDCVVLVATVRALKHHGGVTKSENNLENLPALEKGSENILRHIENLRTIWKLPVVVAVNHFESDSQAEIDSLCAILKKHEIPCEVCNAWALGGKGAEALARQVKTIADKEKTSAPAYVYGNDEPLSEKICAIAKYVYRAKSVNFSAGTLQQLKRYSEEGYADYPVCIAKTQYSFSDDMKLIGAPNDFTISIKSVRVSAGAGFIVAFAGDIIAMPGLPKVPAAINIDVDANGEIIGLF